MDKVKFAGAVRMGVSFARLAVGSPASVANTDRVGAFVFGDFFFKACDFTFGLEKSGRSLLVEGDDAGRIVTTIFKAFEPAN